jgi:CRP-like cAMP-binding protein
VTRTATIEARSEVELLILGKNDYLNVVYESKNLERSNNLAFLLSMQFFKDWIGRKVEDINKSFAILECKPKQVIYKAGDEANVFYIVRAGKLYMESVVEIENKIRYPIGHQQWEYKNTIKRISYRVKELVRGDMFGHEEILDN